MSSRRTLRIALAGVAAAATLFSVAAFAAPVAAVTSTSASSQVKAEPGKNAEVTIYLTRHGETWLNVEGRMQGWSDSPLTEAGELDAEHLGEGLAEAGVTFKSAYSADMLRHSSTAALALEALGYKGEAVRDKGLREIAFGKFEGATQVEAFTAVAAQLGYPNFVAMLQDPNFDMNTALDTLVALNGDSELVAETHAQVQARVMDSLNAIAAAQAKKGGGNVLVVSSGITIMAALEAMGADLSNAAAGVDNAAVSELSYKNGVWTVKTVNDSSYVEAGAN